MAIIIIIDVNTYQYYFFPNQIRNGPHLIGSIAQRLGHECRVYGTFTGVNWEAVRQADLVLVSTLTASANLAYKVAARLRLMGKKFVLGGSHATINPDECLDHFDYVFRGEGEVQLENLINLMLFGGDPSVLPGLSWKSNEGKIHNPMGEKNADLSETRDFGILRVGADRMHHRVRNLMFSRGCPHNCKFCSIRLIFPGKVRYAPIDSVLREVRGFKGDVVIMDDNFYACRERALEIIQRFKPLMANRKLSIQTPVKIAFDDQLMRELASYETKPTLTLGIESASDDSLGYLGKSTDAAMIKEAIKVIKRYGMTTVGMFIVGADTDGPDCVRKTVDFAIQHHLDYLILFALVPLPGTEIRKQIIAERRLLDLEWSYYDGHHVLFLPKHITPLRLQTEIWSGLSRFYARPGFLLRNLHHLYKHPQYYYRSLSNQVHAQKTLKQLEEISRKHYNGNELKDL